jgi:hypothetical protein
MATGLTTNYSLPYPLLTDPVRVSRDIKQLSDELDAFFTAPEFINGIGITGDLAVNGGDVTTTSTTATLFNTNATTLSIGGAATTVNIGNASGQANFAGDVNIATGKVYEINNVSVLSATTLGSSVINSSLTSVGTIATGTWNATTIAVNKGGTGLTSYTIGDIVYASGTTTLAKLAGVATGNALISGGVGAAPSWGKIALTTHVSGTLPVANGGTGVTTSTGTGNVVLSASPTFTGTPLSTTAAADTNTTQIATTAFVVGQASATNPLALGTVAIGTSLKYARQDHVHPTTGLGLTSGTLAQFASTTSAQLAGVISDETGFSTGAVLVFSISPALTGTPTAPTAAVDTSTTQLATTAYVVNQGYLKSSAATTTYAPLASPTFTGTVTVPTLLLSTDDTNTAATHYFVETATDGVVRPKTLANVKTEIVTTAAVNAAAATTVGTVTSGTWSATTIAVNKGGTGLTGTPTNGQLLIGNGTGYSLATLTAGTNITITNTAGGITINSTASGGGTTTNPLSLKFDGGTTEGTDLYTFDGSTAKTIDLIAGSNITLTKAAGSITIASTGGGDVSLASVLMFAGM